MKRVLVAALATSLVVASPAIAATKKKKKPAPKPKPIAMTYYLHGEDALGEVEQPALTGVAMAMDKTKPSGTQEKSKQVTNYVGGPNTQCAGNSLFPFWEGPVSGTLTGTYKIVIHTAGAPSSSMRIRLFDTPGELACNDAYPAAILDKTVSVPQGEGVVTLTGAFTSPKEIKGGTLQLQLSPSGTLGDTSQVRAFYDATTAESSVSFSCLPKVGKKTC